MKEENKKCFLDYDYFNKLEQMKKIIYPGRKFECIKSVYMFGNPKEEAYIEGKTYECEIEDEISVYITDEYGNKHHGWVMWEEEFYKFFKPL
jgi:hypothetical protein